MDQNLNYVAKQLNPPNVPHTRPIQSFWGWLSQKVYEGGWEAHSEDQLHRVEDKRIRLEKCGDPHGGC